MCKRVAIVVGHTSKRPGAVSVGGVSEYRFNDPIAHMVADKLAAIDGVEGFVVYRGLPNALRALPAKINAQRPDLILSLHFNAASFSASGSEMLYCKGSKNGRRFARLLQKEILAALGVRDRGVKSRVRKDRGGYLLTKTAAPAVIAEPFFGSNRKDWDKAKNAKNEIADAYVRAIRAYFGV